MPPAGCRGGPQDRRRVPAEPGSRRRVDVIIVPNPYMISSTQMRPGMAAKLNNDLFSVFSVAHRPPGNLRGFVQAKMRTLKSGTMIDHRFSSEDQLERAILDEV